VAGPIALDDGTGEFRAERDWWQAYRAPKPPLLICRQGQRRYRCRENLAQAAAASSFRVTV
jgi:hypothetical protein